MLSIRFDFCLAAMVDGVHADCFLSATSYGFRLPRRLCLPDRWSTLHCSTTRHHRSGLGPISIPNIPALHSLAVALAPRRRFDDGPAAQFPTALQVRALTMSRMGLCTIRLAYSVVSVGAVFWCKRVGSSANHRATLIPCRSRPAFYARVLRDSADSAATMHRRPWRSPWVSPRRFWRVAFRRMIVADEVMAGQAGRLRAAAFRRPEHL